MIQGNYFQENTDLLNHFNHFVPWDEIVEAYEHGFSDAKKYEQNGDDLLAFAPGSLEEALEYYKQVLEATGDIAGNQISASALEIDHEGLKFENGVVTFPAAMLQNFETLKEAGIVPFSALRKFGGLGIPLVVQAMYMELLARADASFSIAVGAFNLSETIEKFGSEEMKKEFVPAMTSAEICGAMALTEPDYGSDLANIKTRATKDENGIWKLNGTKRFITHAVGLGDYPAVILTLARTGSPTSGARGLSFFLVKSQDVKVTGIEKKLGLTCSPTCEVVYEDSPAELIGEEGLGLVRYSMSMMNNARLNIAAQAMGIAQAACSEGFRYAKERYQFGKPIEEIPAVKKMMHRMNREVLAMRGLLVEAARTVDQYIWRSMRLKEEGMDDKSIRKDEHVRKWEKLANLFTPLSKFYISEKANEVSYDALQIHGGSGYIREYDAERIYRDARITNIYEGTSQLQVVAAIGGIVSGMSSSGFLRSYIEESLGSFEPSPVLKRIHEGFEKITSAYRDIEVAETRDLYSWEIVESLARFISGVQLEKSAALLPDEIGKKERRDIARQYNADTVAYIEGNLLKLELEQKD